MWIFNRLALILALLAATSARGDGISGGVGQNLGGGISGFDQGVSSTGSFTPSPPAGCTGVIDLSTGCVMPMLGGI